MFRRAAHQRAFEDVISQIQSRILEGKLQAGDRLPSERQLQEDFQISRNTLREALRALEQKGLITVKTGMKGGAIICPVDTKGVSESLDLLLQYQKISLAELSEFREEVEGLVAAKAAAMAKKEDIAYLRGLLGSIEEALPRGEPGWDDISRLDTLFHLRLARITRNRMYESVLHTVHDNMNHYFEQFLFKNQTVFRNTYKELCRITEAIEKKDPEGARAGLQRHLQRYSGLMKAKEKESKVETPQIVNTSVRI
jgi:GntR family transcriptional regulator, transcriptional repressor for pyruvate dehydrogenase complex